MSHRIYHKPTYTDCYLHKNLNRFLDPQLTVQNLRDQLNHLQKGFPEKYCYYFLEIKEASY